MSLLSPGDRFPDLSLTVPGGETVDLPGAFAGRYGVVLFFRGAWCPFCNAQLRAFQRAQDGLVGVGAGVVAASVDDEDTTRALIAEHHLTFPVAYGLDADTVTARTGAFANTDPVFVQSTGFVLDPTGNVVVSVYSSGAIGRLLPEDVTGLIRYHAAHAAHAASAAA